MKQILLSIVKDYVSKRIRIDPEKTDFADCNSMSASRKNYPGKVYSVRFSISFSIILIFLSVVLTGCPRNYHQKTTEIIYFYNATDTTIYIQYGFISPSDSFSLVFFPNKIPGTNIDCIKRNEVSVYTFNDSLINQLWMSEETFHKEVSKIRIFKVLNQDTIYVNPIDYATKSKWEVHFRTGYDFISNEILNYFAISDSMFNY